MKLSNLLLVGDDTRSPHKKRARTIEVEASEIEDEGAQLSIYPLPDVEEDAEETFKAIRLHLRNMAKARARSTVLNHGSKYEKIPSWALSLGKTPSHYFQTESQKEQYANILRKVELVAQIQDKIANQQMSWPGTHHECPVQLLQRQRRRLHRHQNMAEQVRKRT